MGGDIGEVVTDIVGKGAEKVAEYCEDNDI